MGLIGESVRIMGAGVMLMTTGAGLAGAPVGLAGASVVVITGLTGVSVGLTGAIIGLNGESVGTTGAGVIGLIGESVGTTGAGVIGLTGESVGTTGAGVILMIVGLGEGATEDSVGAGLMGILICESRKVAQNRSSSFSRFQDSGASNCRDVRRRGDASAALTTQRKNAADDSRIPIDVMNIVPGL